MIGFSGRENDAPLGIWGTLANQLGKRELFNDYYSPLQAPGQSAWINLLQGPPTLILLDELPPYFQDAKSKTVGNSDLAQVTTTALSNLLVAINKNELSNVCLVIADLKATYEDGGQALNSALKNLEGETRRSAQSLAPVALNNNEIFQILRTRLFATLPSPTTIERVSGAYSQSVKDARDMDLTNANPGDTRSALLESYPFHFSLRDLYARFRENPGFQQTRALIKLMRVITARMWDSKAAENRALIHPYDLDLNDGDLRAEIESINPKLGNAIAHDISSAGQSVAENIDRQIDSSSRDCQDLANLLLVSSLSTVSGAARGLHLNDLIAFLAAPGREVAHLKKNVILPFSTQAWYLHTDREGRLYFKDVQNVRAKLQSHVDSYTREIKARELQRFLEKSFAPQQSDCYQKVVALPAPDELRLEKDQVLLVIAEPSSGGQLGEKLCEFWEDATYKNRVLFLSGDRMVMDRLYDRISEVKAADAIIKELEAEELSANDQQLTIARDLRDNCLQQLLSAVREGFTTLHYPTREGLRTADFLMNFRDNEYNGEAQIRDALGKKQRFTTEIDTDSFRKKCEARLFTQQVMDFAEVTSRAATNAAWQWHIPSALDTLKSRMISEGQWRAEGSLINKGPFAAPKTDVQVQQLTRNLETGEVTLRIVPMHGEHVHYEISAPATPGSAQVTDFNNFRTRDLNLSFLCIDSTGTSETGPPRPWQNPITLRQRFFQQGDHRMCEFLAAPPAPIYYTTDGSKPDEQSALYEEPFPVPEGTIIVQAIATKEGVTSAILRKDVPKGTEKISIDPQLPATFSRAQKFDSVKEVYDFLNDLEKAGARLAGLQATIGSEHWIEINADEDTPLDRSQLDSLLDPIRQLIGEDHLTLRCDRVLFQTGQDFSNWISDHRLEIQDHEFSQSPHPVE